jgi:hypothetical protein
MGDGGLVQGKAECGPRVVGGCWAGLAWPRPDPKNIFFIFAFFSNGAKLDLIQKWSSSPRTIPHKIWD